MARFLRTHCAVVLLSSSVILAGCTRSTEKMPEAMQTYSVKGVVVSTDAAAGEVTLQHEAIPGFMEAMTMPYKLEYANMISELHPGDVIRARLKVQKSKDGDVTSARLDEVAVLAEARPNFKPVTNYNVPATGQAVPNFHFTNQDGKPIDVEQFRGKVLLVTFIYTRCPLGDFCPKMSRDFAAVLNGVLGDPALKKNTQLLSLSFDPAFDTPQVLRSYGQNYTGKDGFAHWQFAAPVKDTLPAVKHFFNIGATPGDNQTINHSLSTVLVDPAGKVAAWYPGNEWKPDEVLAKMRTLAQSKGGQ